MQHLISDRKAYSLRPKKKSFWDSKFIPKNKSLYPIQKVHVHVRINYYQIQVTNRGKHGHFTFLLICPKISRMTCILGRRVQSLSSYNTLTGEGMQYLFGGLNFQEGDYSHLYFFILGALMVILHSSLVPFWKSYGICIIACTQPFSIGIS